MALLKPASAVKIADDIDMLRDKVSLFRVIGAAVNSSTGVITFGTKPIHWLENVYDTEYKRVYEEINTEDFVYMETVSNKKISPHYNRPVFYRKTSDTLVLRPVISESTIICDYITKPVDTNWGYVVVQEKALYNENASTNFELHDSEEGSLVNKILELAGITLNKPPLSEPALRNEQLNETDKNN